MSSVTINTKDFADPDFNPKKWINSVLKSTANPKDEDEGSKNTTIIVTKLQIASESTSRQFDQLSTQIIKSMPRILYDLKVISDDAKATHQDVEAVRKNLGLVEGHTESVIDNLRRPHVAKTRMEECRMILLEKSDHLNRLREEQEQREAQAKAEARAREEAEAKAEAEQKAAAEQEARRLEEEAALAAKAEQEEILAKEKEKEKQVAEQAKQPIDELSEEEEQQEEESDDDDYGQVQLPPLRQLEPKTRTTLQQLNTQPATATEENNSYLSPQVSSVFKRIGVPVSCPLNIECCLIMNL